MGVEIHALPAKATSFLIDGQPANPWLVAIDLKSKGSPLCSIELILDVPNLIFEMKQYGVILTRDSVRQFVSDDIRDHGGDALDVYLMLVRYALNPPPRRKSFGWFARMFTSPPKWTPPPVQWKWTTVNEIRLSDNDALVIKGECCQIAVPTQALPA
jgi:hypothetical protein